MFECIRINSIQIVYLHVSTSALHWLIASSCIKFQWMCLHGACVIDMNVSYDAETLPSPLKTFQIGRPYTNVVQHKHYIRRRLHVVGDSYFPTMHAHTITVNIFIFIITSCRPSSSSFSTFHSQVLWHTTIIYYYHFPIWRQLYYITLEIGWDQVERASRPSSAYIPVKWHTSQSF